MNNLELSQCQDEFGLIPDLPKGLLWLDREQTRFVFLDSEQPIIGEYTNRAHCKRVLGEAALDELDYHTLKNMYGKE